jgi:hypothetical protein
VESAVGAKILAGDIDISNAYPDEEALEPIGLIWSWTSLRLMLSTLREDVSLTGVRFRELSKQPLGDRRLIVFGGGGNGYAIHAYIAVTKAGERLTRYAIDDGPTQDSIRLPLTSAVQHELEISFTPRDTAIYEWEVAVEFYRSDSDEYYENVFGPFATSGLPDDGGRHILVEGDTVSEQDSLEEGSLLTTVFPELSDAD